MGDAQLSHAWSTWTLCLEPQSPKIVLAVPVTDPVFRRLVGRTSAENVLEELTIAFQASISLLRREKE